MTFSVLLILFASIALSCNFSKISASDVPPIFVFGDSLADVGNNNFVNTSFEYKANFAYNGIDLPDKAPTGRFSNGYNTIDWIAKFIGQTQSPPAFHSIRNDSQMLQGVNFASGGSGILNTTDVTTLTFKTQIEDFKGVVDVFINLLGKENTTTILSKSIFLISSGSNDMFAYYLANIAMPNAARHDQFVANLIEEFVNHIETLYNLGARKFGILGLSQIGCIPAMRSASPTGDCVKELNNMAVLFNLAMQNKLIQLRSTKLTEMKYSYGNVFPLLLTAVQQPKLFGYKEIQSACCGAGKFNGESMCTAPNATLCADRTEYIFWDRFHPTEASSRNTANAIYRGSRQFAVPINIMQLVGG